MVWVKSMDRKKQDVSNAIETTRRWNILMMMFVAPLFVGMCILAPYLLSTFGKYANQNQIGFAQPVTSLEFHLVLSDSLLGGLFFICWAIYILIYIVSKQNRIKAYIINLYLMMTMFFVTCYGMFVGLQFFVPFLFIRLIYWILFFIAVCYIIYIVVTKHFSEVSYFTKDRTKKITNIILFLWAVCFISSIMLNNLENLIVQLILSMFPLAPIFIISIMIFWYRSSLSSLINLREVDQNQEQYRQEFGYSVEEWYGKKSRQYKEFLNKKD